MSLVPVLDVEDISPLRGSVPSAARARWRSFLLVVVTFVVTCSVGLVVAAPANAWAGAAIRGVSGLVATTVAGEVVFTKNDDGGDTDESKKKRGKWGGKLKGLPGLGAALIASMLNTEGMGEMFDMYNDIKAPDDFAADVHSVDGSALGTNKPPLYRNWTVDPRTVNFNVPATSGVQSGPGLTIKATCSVARSDGIACPAAGAAVLISSGAIARCFNSSTGLFYERGISVNLNAVKPSMPTCWRSIDANNSINDSVQSVIFRTNPTQNTAIDGYPTAVRVVNPDFDDSVLPEDLQTGVTAEGKCRVPGTGELLTVSRTVAGTKVIPTVDCPDGSVPESIDWTGHSNGYSENLGGVGTDWSAFPACAGLTCEKMILLDDVPCRVGIAECYDWQNVQPPSRLKCEYGPYALGLAECGDLGHLYKTTHGVTPDSRPENDPDRVPGWLPSNPDGTVDWTKVGTEIQPDANPNPDYRAPVRWNPNPNGDTGPTPTPTPTAQPPVFPTTGVNPPGVPTGVDPPKDPDAPTKTCLQQAWSFNPVDWVFIPVKCAFVWAFIPKAGAGSGLVNGAKANFDKIGLAPWLGIFPAFISAIPTGSAGCTGPALTVPAMMGGATYYPLNACSDPMAKYAQMSRSVMSVVVTFAGLISIMNSLSVAVTGYRAYEREGLAAEAAANARMEKSK